jgi:hypothetical protein
LPSSMVRLRRRSYPLSRICFRGENFIPHRHNGHRIRRISRTKSPRLGRVLMNRGSRARLDPCPLSGALRTQTGHPLRSEKCQLRHTNTYSIPSSARASTVGGMVRKRLPGLPTTVILFEPSVGLPTSADGPHPRREGFDDGRLRTMGHRDEIKPVAGQSERMRLHELSAP